MAGRSGAESQEEENMRKIYTYESDNLGTAEPYFYYTVSLIENDGGYCLTGESNDPRAILHTGDMVQISHYAAEQWLRDHDTLWAIEVSIWSGSDSPSGF